MSRSKWIKGRERVRIVISKETHERLKGLKSKNEPFDSVINRLIASYVHKQLRGY